MTCCRLEEILESRSKKDLALKSMSSPTPEVTLRSSLNRIFFKNMDQAPNETLSGMTFQRKTKTVIPRLTQNLGCMSHWIITVEFISRYAWWTKNLASGLPAW